jgi:hypothetical protein
MKIGYLHASKYGNGAMVAEEFSKQMAAQGTVLVTDIKGPLEEGWQHKAKAFAARIPSRADHSATAGK